MPLYEYECARTGKRFEAIQKFSDAPLTRCPECDQHPECEGEAKKLLSAPAIQFKGAGWYVNDYGKGNSGPSKSAGDSKPADTKSDAKPAAKESSAKKAD